MLDSAIEKRATRRFSIRLPISLKSGTGAGEVELRTRDVSARGLCFYSDRAFAPGADVQFTLTLPPEVTQTESIPMRCMGRVVRVEHAALGGGLSIAIIIDRYEFLGDGRL